MISLARLFSLKKREAVLSAAAALALLSMLWVPPDGAYLSYVDWRTMAQLFCLMAVMAGLRELGVFSRLGRQLLCRVRSARQLECVLVFLCFFTSMAITNDVALLTFVPFSLEVLTLAGREERAVPVVVFQTVAAKLVSMYTPIAQTIVGTMEVINEATSLTSERAQEFAQFMAQSATEQGEMIAEYDKHSLQSEVASGEDNTGAMQHELDKKMEEDEMTGVRSSVEKIVQLLNPANLATLVLHGISALLVGIIQVVILGIGVVIVKLLVILGPFVFAVSMLPVFQKQLSIWFGTLCSACMVFTVINILNQIMWQTFKAIYTESADMVDAATQQIQYLGMDLALIGAYCSCFWLSSKIVGHSDAGKIISKTVSIVTTAATIALMGGAAAGGKLTNVGGAASIGASFINDNNKK